MYCHSSGYTTKTFPVQTARLDSFLARSPPQHLYRHRPRPPRTCPRPAETARDAAAPLPRPGPACPGSAARLHPAGPGGGDRRARSPSRRRGGPCRAEPSRAGPRAQPPPPHCPAPRGRSGFTCSQGVKRGCQPGAHGGAGGACVCAAAAAALGNSDPVRLSKSRSQTPTNPSGDNSEGRARRPPGGHPLRAAEPPPLPSPLLSPQDGSLGGERKERGVRVCERAWGERRPRKANKAAAGQRKPCAAAAASQGQRLRGGNSGSRGGAAPSCQRTSLRGVQRRRGAAAAGSASLSSGGFLIFFFRFGLIFFLVFWGWWW